MPEASGPTPVPPESGASAATYRGGAAHSRDGAPQPRHGQDPHLADPGRVPGTNWPGEVRAWTTTRTRRAPGPTGPVTGPSHRPRADHRRTERPDLTVTDQLRPIPPGPALARPSSTAPGTASPRPDAAGDGQHAADPRPAADGAPAAIEVSHLCKRFKDMVAVADVSFSVPAGSIVALLGPNGAGKTTTVNMLCTLMRPDGGHATVAGYDILTDAPSVRRSIALTGQFAALDETLTGRENLVLFGRLLGLKKREATERAEELLNHFSLLHAADKRVREYSGGMRRRIDIACGLVTWPEVVFLDEPTTGLDPRSRQDVWTLVERLKASGVTTLLTTQYLEEADMLADNIVVIDKGRVIAEGTSAELKAQTGSAYCDVTPEHASDLPRLIRLVSDMLSPSMSEPDDLTVSIPAPLGADTLVEVVQRTTAAGVKLRDITMRRPSLDEVFLHLTDPSRKEDPAT